MSGVRSGSRGGFLNNLTSNDEAKAFVYAFDGGAFPNVPLIQPRLNSVEEWRFVNHNNDEHPIHVHVNDFQVIEYYDPTTGLRTGPDKFGIDNANTPAPTMYSDETVIEPGILSIRTRFDNYTGLYVMHCHRLNHEDNGLMALISVIPEISSYAVAVPGTPGKATEVHIYDGNGDRLLATVTPFPGHQGSVSVAMGDVDDDGVYDLLVGAGKDRAAEVVVYSGKAKNGKASLHDRADTLPPLRESRRVAASALPPRRSTGRALTTSLSAPVSAFRARSGSMVRSCRHRLAPRRRCSRRSIPIAATARASALAPASWTMRPAAKASSPRPGRGCRPR